MIYVKRLFEAGRVLSATLFAGWPMLFRGAWHYIRTGNVSQEIKTFTEG